MHYGLNNSLHTRSNGLIHVKGHSHNPWNDLADALAGRALTHDWFTFDVDPLLGIATFDMADLVTVQWLWLFELSMRGHSNAPVLHQRQWKFNAAAPLNHQPVADLHPFIMSVEEPTHVSASSFVRLRVATANVLTLYPQSKHGAAYMSARAEALAHQFHRAGVQCVGVQESRCKKHGHDFFEGFHVLSGSATSRGHGGVQLWISRKIATPDGELEITHEHLRIFHADDRRLIVRLHHPQLCLLFLVLHAPCDDAESVLSDWWKQTSSLIPSSFGSWTWCVLADANSRVVSISSKSVGNEGAEVENLRGSFFHEWLLRHNLWLPQTFSSTHHGRHDTWQHASHGTGRIDYIGISDDVATDDARTWVSDDVDLSIARGDHAAVCADVWFALKPSVSLPPVPRAQPSFPDPAWHHDVHTHAAILQARYRGRQPSSHKGSMRKKHLTDETCVLIRRKKAAWKQLRKQQCEQRQILLRAVFQAWCSPEHDFSHDRCQYQHSFRHCALAAEHYRLASLQVCFAVRRDDKQFYEDLAEETGRQAEKGYHRVWDAIKPMLPKWRNRRKHNLRCTGPTIAQRVQHYCDLESGAATSYCDLLLTCHSDQQTRGEDVPLQLDLHQLPSRLEIEHRLQRITLRRAPGPDQLTPDFLREHSPEVAEDLFQLALKMWMTGCEPLQWKGGWIHSISKKTHSTKVEHMRGILLMDVLGKVMHATLRARFLPSLQQWKLPLQLGGFPSCSTLFATQYLREFQQQAASKHLPSAVLFIDVKSAFHCMIRQLLFGPTHPFSEGLKTLLEEAGCDVQAVWDEIEPASKPFLDNVPLCEKRLLQDAHHHTWCRIRCHF